MAEVGCFLCDRNGRIFAARFVVRKDDFGGYHSGGNISNDALRLRCDWRSILGNNRRRGRDMADTRGVRGSPRSNWNSLCKGSLCRMRKMDPVYDDCGCVLPAVWNAGFVHFS